MSGIEAFTQKPTLIFFCGLAGTGKRTVIDVLRKKLPNAIRLQKDVLSDTLLIGLDHASKEYKAIKDRIYAALGALAFDNLDGGRSDLVAIMQGYYGDKLTKPGTVEAITREDVNVKIVYLHCDASTQKERLIARNLARDKDKLGPNMDGTDAEGRDIFTPYRLQHIKNHLAELARVSEFLILDTAYSPEESAQIIAKYILEPSSSITIAPTLKHPEKLAEFTMEDRDVVTLMSGDINGFMHMLNDLQPDHPGVVIGELERPDSPEAEYSDEDDNEIPAGRVNNCDRVAAGALWLYNSAVTKAATWLGLEAMLQDEQIPTLVRLPSPTPNT